MKSLTILSPRAYPVFDPSAIASFGGAEVQLYLLANAAKMKYPEIRICFIVADYGQPYCVITELGVVLYSSFRFSDSLPRRVLAFLRTFIQVDHETIVQRAISPFTPIIFLLTKLLGKRFVYMVACDAEVDGTHASLRSTVLRGLFNWTLRRADVLVAQNSYQRENIVRTIRREPFLLRNGLNITSYRPNVGRNLVLYVGRNDWQKRPEIMIEIMRDLPWIEFVMVCNPAFDIRGADYDAIKSTAEALSNCSFIEVVDYEGVNELFASARILVNTSVTEGFPNTYLQAAMHSVPILSLEANPDNILHQHGIGVCTEGNIEMLKLLLTDFHTDNVIVERMGRKAYEYVSKNHDITQMAEQFIQLVSPADP